MLAPGLSVHAARPRVVATLLAVAIGLAGVPLSAEPVAATPSTSGSSGHQKTAFEKLTAPRDLIKTAPEAAVLNGAWSAVLQFSTLMTSGRYGSPQPKGIIAQEATRLLYGGSWTAMLALEAYAVLSFAGGNFDFLAEASYRMDWLMAATLPACPAKVSYGGCGIGVGGFGSLRIRPKGSWVSFEAGGGWIEQRAAHDERRTVSESMWVLMPLGATVGVETPSAPLGLFVRAGPGAYFGMHNGHLHPHGTGPGKPTAPWHEMYPIDVGVGPGGTVHGGLVVAKKLRVEAELVVAVLPLGKSWSTVSPDLAPLHGSEGVPSFRLLSFGATWDDPTTPFRFGASLFRAELSTRPLSNFGHAGGMVRLEFPLRVSP